MQDEHHPSSDGEISRSNPTKPTQVTAKLATVKDLQLQGPIGRPNVSALKLA
ncbi:hypothetical protein ASPCADRAFT_210483 [Aspergillus carbonarius ITEM 5010]|uniref:Uncharacterized protein n=1 Tax=Aspergillus carbonarius (strain ITEM 5010) TaxID=602072 RepID=A0A1R3RC64_ASPC5|nr:hypothetical protein ASPCADRAFT_210483 [Aspergillus carbonarius ITEM 5010]